MKYIIYDNDLDGMLSAYYLSLFVNATPILYTELKEKRVKKIYYVDKAIDLIKKEIVFMDLKPSRIEIYDHHLSGDFNLADLTTLESSIILELNTPSTFYIVSRHYNNPIIKKSFNKKFGNLIRYMHKVENERFDKFNNKDWFFYFNFYSLIKKLSNYNLKYKLRTLSTLYEKVEVNNDYIEKMKEKTYQEVIEKTRILFRNKNYTILNLYDNCITLYLPYFFKNKNYFAIYKRNNSYHAQFRVNNLELFKLILENFEGGGRKIFGKERYIGVIHFNNKDELLKILKS
ncbi:MAG: hypothetical protein ABGW69_01595 [Nanoarchaeota archaeon]